MVKVLENTAFNGLEVYFDDKPEQSIIDGLKNLMFKWHGIKKCWFAKKTEERENFVKTLSGVCAPGTVVENATSETITTTKKEFELKYMANGIKDKSGKYYSGYYGFDKISLNLRFNHSKYSDIPCPTGATYEDDTDSQTDYFCRPSIVLNPACGDYLGILDGYKKQEEHRKKLDEKRGCLKSTDFESLYSGYYKQYKWTCKTESELKKLAEDFANRDLISIKEHDEALKLAEGLAAVIDNDKIFAVIEERKTAEKERQHNISCESNLKMAENWLKNGGSICGGIAEKIGHYAILKDDKKYQIMFEHTQKLVYNLIILDLETGERHANSGEYEGDEARQKAIDELI